MLNWLQAVPCPWGIKHCHVLMVEKDFPSRVNHPNFYPSPPPMGDFICARLHSPFKKWFSTETVFKFRPWLTGLWTGTIHIESQSIHLNSALVAWEPVSHICTGTYGVHNIKVYQTFEHIYTLIYSGPSLIQQQKANGITLQICAPLSSLQAVAYAQRMERSMPFITSSERNKINWDGMSWLKLLINLICTGNSKVLWWQNTLPHNDWSRAHLVPCSPL